MEPGGAADLGPGWDHDDPIGPLGEDFVLVVRAVGIGQPIVAGKVVALASGLDEVHQGPKSDFVAKKFEPASWGRTAGKSVTVGKKDGLPSNAHHFANRGVGILDVVNDAKLGNRVKTLVRERQFLAAAKGDEFFGDTLFDGAAAHVRRGFHAVGPHVRVILPKVHDAPARTGAYIQDGVDFEQRNHSRYELEGNVVLVVLADVPLVEILGSLGVVGLLDGLSIVHGKGRVGGNRCVGHLDRLL